MARDCLGAGKRKAMAAHLYLRLNYVALGLPRGEGAMLGKPREKPTLADLRFRFEPQFAGAARVGAVLALPSGTQLHVRR
jgi:hypothetical protein